MPRSLLILTACLLLSTGCNFPTLAALNANNVVVGNTAPQAPVVPVTPTVVTAIPTLSGGSLALNATLVPSPATAQLSPTPFTEPAGCKRPPDDYTRLVVNGARLNARTLWMLRYAKTLYQGTIDFPGLAITQGSYNPGGVAASFGTHDAGGAVDLSVLNLRTGAVLRDELPTAIRALRIAGFAAWVREPDELYQGSPIHIHAIAIGDAQLSPAARDQLTGQFGYFLGYNGLPKTDNIPVPDKYGGPILCQWMLDLGYRDMRH